MNSQQLLARNVGVRLPYLEQLAKLGGPLATQGFEQVLQPGWLLREHLAEPRARIVAHTNVGSVYYQG